MPVDAITTTHASARSGLAPLLRHLRWPVSAFRRMPLGNVLRAPRRTLLTAFGIGAAIATLVVVLGMLDSFTATMDRNEAELLGDHPDRVSATLDGFVLESGPEIASIEAADTVGVVEPVLRLGSTLSVAGPRRGRGDARGHRPRERRVGPDPGARVVSPTTAPGSCWPRRPPTTSASRSGRPSSCAIPCGRRTGSPWPRRRSWSPPSTPARSGSTPTSTGRSWGRSACPAWPTPCTCCRRPGPRPTTCNGSSSPFRGSARCNRSPCPPRWSRTA